MCRPASSIAALFRRLYRHNQADFPSTVRGICKRVFQPTRGEMVPLAVRQAWKTMVTGRPGPVVLDVPFDVFMESAAEEAPNAKAWNGNISSRCGADPEGVVEGCRHAAWRRTAGHLCRPGDPLWRRGRRIAAACRASADSCGGFGQRPRRDRLQPSALAGNGGAWRPLPSQPRDASGRRAAGDRHAVRRSHFKLVDSGLLLHHSADTADSR